VNYLPADAPVPTLPVKYEAEADFLQAFRAVSRPGSPFFTMVDNNNANLAYVRIRREKGGDLSFSVVINRWHDNVAFLIKEEGRLDPSKDSADFIHGLIGSYPNYFFDVSEKDFPDFIDVLAHFDNSPKNLERLTKYGVNRADNRLWETYDWFQQRFNEEQPVRGGLFDLNRYYFRASE
jgi:hypothetical protein